MFSVLWTCTPSLLARAWSRAVLPREGEPVRQEVGGGEAKVRPGQPRGGKGNIDPQDQRMKVKNN